jgi:HlyD family secretion protein
MPYLKHDTPNARNQPHRLGLPRLAGSPWRTSSQAVAALALLLGSASAALHSHAQSSAPVAAPASAGTTARPAMTVTVAQPLREAMTQRLAANGNIAAWQDMSVSAEVAGPRIRELRAQVGDSVKAGQVLAVLDDEALQADLRLAQATLADAQAQLAEAAANAARARSLDGTGALSAQQAGQMLAAEQSARARVDMASAQLASQQLRLRHTQITAPDAGVITARTALLGGVAQPGLELFRLIRHGRLEWRGEVTANELPRIASGQGVHIALPNGTTLAGRVRLVAPTVDPQTRNALVYVDVQQPAQGVAPARPGMFARGEFVVPGSQALSVPAQALVVRDGFHFVFVIDANNKAHQRKVDTGRRAAERVEIVKGLQAHERVAVAGAGFLNDGDTVRIGVAAPTKP